jgi:hypothetical protein
MHAWLAWGFAGVAAVCGVAALVLAFRRARRRAAPRFVVTPAVPYCQLRSARVLAAAWRARGLAVTVSRRVAHVRTPEGARAVVELPASGTLGDVPFAIRTHHAGLVAELAAIASRELGPLACSIDGYVHGFDHDPAFDDGDAEIAYRFRAGAGAAAAAVEANSDHVATQAMSLPTPSCARPPSR